MSGVSNVRRTEGEPHSRLTELCDRMTRDLPEGVKALVMLDEGEDAGMVAHGYGDDAEVREAFSRHRRAFLITAEQRLPGERAAARLPELRFCSACGKEPRTAGLDLLRWIGHHALCPRYGKAPDLERKP